MFVHRSPVIEIQGKELQGVKLAYFKRAKAEINATGKLYLNC